MGECGVAFRVDSFMFNLAFRYTSMEHDASPDIGASNVSLHFAGQYLLL